jgi:hypothetical protein
VNRLAFEGRQKVSKGGKPPFEQYASLRGWPTVARAFEGRKVTRREASLPSKICLPSNGSEFVEYAQAAD